MFKKLLIYLAPLLLVTCVSKQGQETGTYDPGADEIQIVLFHLEKRCASCNAVERETLSVLEQHFKDEVEAGMIRFISYDFQGEEGKQAAELLKASGQTLFVIKEENIADLTSEAFMFALTLPDRYREALKAELEKMLD